MGDEDRIPRTSQPASLEYTATNNKRDPALNKMESKEGLTTEIVC